jgi:hypothetical protein
MLSRKKRTRLKRISFILMLISIVVSVFIVKKQTKDECIQLTEKYKGMRFDGIVTKKFKDREKHSAKTLYIQGQKGKQTFVKYRDMSGFYENVEFGDSIFKPKGTLKVKVLIEKNDTAFTIDFECDEI